MRVGEKEEVSESQREKKNLNELRPVVVQGPRSLWEFEMELTHIG